MDSQLPRGLDTSLDQLIKERYTPVRPLVTEVTESKKAGVAAGFREKADAGLAATRGAEAGRTARTGRPAEGGTSLATAGKLTARIGGAHW